LPRKFAACRRISPRSSPPRSFGTHDRVFVPGGSLDPMARAARQIRLSGVFPSAITPHHPKTREADYASALELVDFLATAAADGVCLFGATGEFLNYAFDERQRLLSLAVKRSRVPVIADVSHSTLSDALQLADSAVSAGADALKIMPPYFFRYEQS